MTISLIIDILIIAMLTATTGYCVVVNRRLGQLRGDRDEFVKMIESFNSATERAEASVARLGTASEHSGRELGDRIEKAQALCNDLNFLIDRGGRLRGQVNGPADETPKTPKRRPTAPADGPAPGLDDGLLDSTTLGGITRLAESADSVVEHELLEALRAARKK